MSSNSDFFSLIPNYSKPTSINITHVIPLTKNGFHLTIGKGAFSEVYLAKDYKNETKIYAIKHMNKQNILKQTFSLEFINNEIEIHSRLNHKNIIQLLNKYENQMDIYLIMEFANRGNLYNLLKKKNFLMKKKHIIILNKLLMLFFIYIHLILFIETLNQKICY
jgi:serine/threonine protein kinase